MRAARQAQMSLPVSTWGLLEAESITRSNIQLGNRYLCIEDKFKVLLLK